MSAPHAILALKAALRARLLSTPAVTAIVGQAVHDAPPREANPPYLVLGDAIARDNGAVASEGHVIDLDLIAVTRERGTRGGLDFAHAIETALASAPIAPEGFQASLVLVRETITRHDPVASLSRVSLRLRAFLHALPAP